MISRYSNLDKSIAIAHIGFKLMVLADGSRWGFLSTGPKELWETGDKVIISDAGSQKAKTLYIIKNVIKNDVSQALFLGSKDL